MSLIARVVHTTTRVIRDLAEAPSVARQLRQLRSTKPAPRTVEVDIDPNDIPDASTIEAAARDYQVAREERRAADRLKRRADRVLKRVPNGTYGPVVITRVESSRQTADLDAIRALFAAHGLGDVPMKVCVPSLTVEFADDQADEEPPASLLVAA